MRRFFKMTIAARHKHFWIRITPTADQPETVVLGTLICEDNERLIISATAEFASSSRKNLGTNWVAQILRPNHSPAFRAAMVAEFIK